jgi:D-alanyl-lipoteichoic acid acyltransferase DltB (MBOAT superfamily)
VELISLTAAAFVAAALLATRFGSPLWRRAALLAFNAAFMATFHPLAPLVCMAASLLGYGAAVLGARRSALALPAALCLPLVLLLFVPKLGDYGGGEEGMAGNVLGSKALVFVGASYFTLRALHFAIDARRKQRLGLGLLDYLVWNSFFPTIVAGPIERAEHFAQSYARLGRAGPEDWAEGAKRIFFGLLKRVVLGQLAFAWARPIATFEVGSELAWSEAWLALYAMCLYAYFDFAGYSDLAIGSARLFGLRLAENFDNPYLRPSISEFWQGWHISLSTWIRDYLFLPMCGRSPSVVRPHLAALASMGLCGLWHAPELGWLLWGLAHGAGLSVHQAWTLFLRKRFALKKKLARSKPYRVLATLATFHFIALTWVLISIDATDLGPAWRYFAILLGFGP